MLRRLLFFLWRDRFDRDLDDELRFKEAMKAQALPDALARRTPAPSRARSACRSTGAGAASAVERHPFLEQSE